MNSFRWLKRLSSLGDRGVRRSVRRSVSGLRVRSGIYDDRRVCGERLEPRCLLAAGALDPMFGTAGKVTTPFGGNDSGSRVVIDGSGRIVVAGNSHNGVHSDFAVARYNADGTLDGSFGVGGKVTTDFAGRDDSVVDVAIDGFGRIVVAGFTDNGSNFDFAVARYTATGALDATFGVGGKVVTSFGVTNDYGYGIAVDGDGKLVVVGSVRYGGGNDDFAIVRYDDDGSLDASFGTGGKVTTSIGSYSDLAYGVAIDANGRIVVAGQSYNVSSSNDFAVVRYNSNGMLDASFDGDGIQTADFGGRTDYVSDVIIDCVGNIVVSGATYALGDNHDFAVARFNADGSLDSTFDGDGLVRTAFGGTGEDFGGSVAMDGNGKLVVVGYTTVGGTYDFGVVRYNTNGSLDSTFGSAGKVVTTFGSGLDIASAVALDGSGRIVVAGRTFNGSNYDFAVARYDGGPELIFAALDRTFDFDGKVRMSSFGGATDAVIDGEGRIVVAGSASNGVNSDFLLARFNTDGSLDTTFGTGGTLLTDFGNIDVANSVTIDDFGRIIVAGYAYNGTDTDVAVARYNSDGTLDTSFDVDGRQVITFGTSTDEANDVQVDGAGRIVVAGYAIVAGSYDFALARFNPNGSLDASFDSDGKVTTAVGVNLDVATSLAIDGDGKLVVAGYAFQLGSFYDVAVVRYNTDGSLDTSFDSDGKQMTDFGGLSDFGHSVALDGDGRIVVAGRTTIGGLSEFAVARYNANGSLDTTFDSDGRQIASFGGSDARGVAVAHNGKIVVTGYATNGSNDDFAVARFLANGSPDTSFDGDGRVLTDIATSTEFGGSVALDCSGRIVVAGTSDSRVALVRYAQGDDFGDAPDTGVGVGLGNYQTTSLDGGARHAAIGPTLGINRDVESDGQPTANADGDDIVGSVDDEDGVIFVTPVQTSATSSSTGTVMVTLQNGAAGVLDAWIDFNRNGVWTDAGEQIFVSVSLVNGSNTLSYTIPAGASVGDSYARFRVSTSGGLLPTGVAADGEVEDYKVAIIVDQPGTPVATTFVINENVPNGTVVGTVSQIDPDGGSPGLFSITGGNTSGAFSINQNTGQIKVANSAAMDFETTPVFTLTVTLTNAIGESNSGLVTVNLLDVTIPLVTVNTPAGGSPFTVLRNGPDIIVRNSASVVVATVPHGNDVLILAINGTNGSEKYILDSSLNGFFPGVVYFNGKAGADCLDATQVLFGVRALGGAGNDTLLGGGGNDSLFGQDGNDSLVGNAGDDTIDGGNGLDTLYGNSGRDSLNGNAGNDRLLGGSDDDYLVGGANADYLDGESGNDVLDGQSGSDTVRGGSGDDSLHGGADNDFLSGGNGNDTLEGEAGNDVLSGGYGSDIVNGGAGKDTCIGGYDVDTVFGGAGKDVVLGGQGGPARGGVSSKDFGDALVGTQLDLIDEAFATLFVWE